MDNTRNWKMKCLNNNGNDSIYTEGKIYEVIDLIFTWDDGYIFDLANTPSCTFDEFKKWSSADWELIEESVDKKIKNWEMRCINRGSNRNYTEGKIYYIIDLSFKLDDGDFFDLKDMGFTTFEQFNNWSGAEWKLVNSKYAEIEKYLNIKNN